MPMSRRRCGTSSRGRTRTASASPGSRSGRPASKTLTSPPLAAHSHWKAVPMTDTTVATKAGHRLPSPATLLAAQVSYQFRLLLATPSALAIGVGFPVVLLIIGNARHSGSSAAGIAGYAVFGLTMTAWNIHGVRLVAARELGILRRWRAAPLPRWCYFAGRIIATSLF